MSSLSDWDNHSAEAIAAMDAAMARQALTLAQAEIDRLDDEVRELGDEVDDLKEAADTRDMAFMDDDEEGPAYSEYKLRPIIERIYHDVRGQAHPESVRELVWETVGWTT